MADGVTRREEQHGCLVETKDNMTRKGEVRVLERDHWIAASENVVLFTVKSSSDGTRSNKQMCE
jgi:hypothetical protein